MKRCISCIIPESYPGIDFDSNGVCSICRKNKGKKRLVPSIEKLRTKLDRIIIENRSKNPTYDALVAFSGGKDSTFLIYKLKENYGLNLLAFTFDNGFLSEQTFSNMRKVLKKLDVDHIVLRPRYDLINRIFAISADNEIYPLSLLKYGSSICISCIRMVTNLSLRTAIEKNIPMIMIGNSPGQLIQSENEIIYQDNKIPYELKKGLFEPLANEIGNEIYYYFLLDRQQYKSKPFPYTINPFPLIGYDENVIYQKIGELGWKRPNDVDPNTTNCQLNALGIIKHKERLNFHPYDYEMSMLVRLGKITRDEALRRVRDPEKKTAALAERIAEELHV